MSAAGLSDCAEPQVRGAEGLPVEGLGADRAAEAVLQATTEASEADQAGLSCRARQTWWITLIVAPLSLRSGASGARPSHWPARSERSERPLGEGAAEMAPGAVQRRSCREPIQGRPVGRPGDRRVRRVRPGARAGRLRAKTDAH